MIAVWESETWTLPTIRDTGSAGELDDCDDDDHDDDDHDDHDHDDYDHDDHDHDYDGHTDHPDESEIYLTKNPKKMSLKLEFDPKTKQVPTWHIHWKINSSRKKLIAVYKACAKLACDTNYSLRQFI